MCHTEELGELEREHEADALACQSLDQREHQFPKAHDVRRRVHEIAEAVDHDPARFGSLDRVEKLVDPLVHIEVDRGTAENVHMWVR